MDGIPTIATLAVQNNQVLLVKHEASASHITDTYGLPGGRIDKGEDERTAASREFFEETGIIVGGEELVEYPENVYCADILRKDGETKRYCMRVFLVLNYKGVIRQGNSETTPEWVDIKRVGELNLLPNVSKAIEDALQFINA